VVDKTLIMKKNITIILIGLISFSAMAQKEITVELEKFTEIKAFDRIQVELIKSNANKVVITGEDRDEVEVVNKNGLLKIRMEADNHMDGRDIDAKVYYSETLSLLDSNEGARIRSNETFTADATKIAAQEGGKIELKVNIDELDVKSTSGGEITLTGTAKTQEVVANAGGKVFNEELRTEQTTVTVNAGGNANVNASDKVIAKVRAGGTIDIYGNPKEVEKNKVFGGKIKVID